MSGEEKKAMMEFPQVLDIDFLKRIAGVAKFAGQGDRNKTAHCFIGMLSGAVIAEHGSDLANEFVRALGFDYLVIQTEKPIIGISGGRGHVKH